ncbi:hypothetical protein F2Q70_00031305 [Brassica cretica]|uniref:Uncharacterized protein n=1 Tax=Brassica cretica TaxID=69181 RepID=A0A8S9FIW8_BRACR|nr:hypothetical protein F2Q70_00031305 [Brassica cretica]
MAASDGISAELAAQHTTFDDLGLGLPSQIGHASMNQDLMVVATKSCSLLFDLYPRIHMNRALKIATTKSRSNSFLFVGILMKQALMVVATKSCSDST